MAELKGSQTEKNLMTAFAGESQARNKYTYYASKAKKEGYVQISKIFEEIRSSSIFAFSSVISLSDFLNSSINVL